MSVLAYILVVLLSQFALTAGTLVVVAGLGVVLGWLPDRVRMPILGLAAGVGGVSLAVLLARLLFSWLAGPGSFGWGPFLAATIPLSIPVWNDWKKQGELTRLRDDMPSRVSEYAEESTAAMRFAPVGAILGVVLNGVLML